MNEKKGIYVPRLRRPF